MKRPRSNGHATAHPADPVSPRAYDSAAPSSRLQAPDDSYIFVAWNNDGCKLRLAAPSWWEACRWARAEFGGEPRLVGYDGSRRDVDVVLRWAGNGVSGTLRIEIERASSTG